MIREGVLGGGGGARPGTFGTHIYYRSEARVGQLARLNNIKYYSIAGADRFRSGGW